jgi:ABC-type nitrate/sulfonate/bicarbonate transport system permease component
MNSSGKLGRYAGHAVFIACFLAVWELASRMEWLNPTFFGRPSGIVTYLWDGLFVSRKLWLALNSLPWRPADRTPASDFDHHPGPVTAVNPRSTTVKSNQSNGIVAIAKAAVKPIAASLFFTLRAGLIGWKVGAAAGVSTAGVSAAVILRSPFRRPRHAPRR